MNLDAEDMADILAGIRDEGGPAVWVTTTLALIDADKPWLGTTPTTKNVPIFMTFVDVATAAALIKQWRPDTELSSSSLFGIMGNHGFDPKVGEVVKRTNEEDLVAKDIATASPTGKALFHVVEFQA